MSGSQIGEIVQGPSGVGGTADAVFWLERQAAFLQWCKTEPAIGAIWHSQVGWSSFIDKYGKIADPITVDVFKSLAMEAAKGLERKTEVDGWVAWLDALREYLRDADETDRTRRWKIINQHSAPNGASMEGSVERRRVVNVEKRMREEWSRLYPGTECPWLEGDTFVDHVRVIEAGEIARLFMESAAYCLRLASIAQCRPAAPDGSHTEPEPAVNVAPRAKANGNGQKRGPKPDYELAARIAEIVSRVAPSGDWIPREYDIREALDEAGVPPPTVWRKRDAGCDCWAAQVDKATAVKAIEYRLDIARKKPTPETLS